MPKITVINTETDETKTFKAGYGANLRKAAAYKDVEIYKGMAKMLNCRGMGVCGTCLIEVEPMENVDPQTFMERLHKVGPNQKLGCRAKVYGDITIKAAIKDL
ncbi:MAG: 2Fe-2S iron-sulfur cluster-binding protein [Nitrospinae bacterium]|jgi:ferredoxin|nr:2Fe-2S iron-sulfur cluster-binding protein [Nitrospinota bacterium]MDA1109236.1 2Fe-2S iron-sulfur cluster-binding protein [Nitrospinota bacterium]